VGRVVEAARSLILLLLLRLRVGELEGVVLRGVGNLYYFLGYILSLLLLMEVLEI
jgi:hypothetical protein